MRNLKLFGFLVLIGICSSFTNHQNSLQTDPIIGKWYLSAINNTDISSIKCYSDSYLDFSEKELKVYISELNPDQNCSVMMQGTGAWENINGKYYVDNMLMDYKITPSGNKLIWMENPELQLVFIKKDMPD